MKCKGRTIADIPSKYKDDDFLQFDTHGYILDSLVDVMLKIEDVNANYKYAIDPRNKSNFLLKTLFTRKMLYRRMNKFISKCGLNMIIAQHPIQVVTSLIRKTFIQYIYSYFYRNHR